MEENISVRHQEEPYFLVIKNRIKKKGCTRKHQRIKKRQGKKRDKTGVLERAPVNRRKLKNPFFFAREKPQKIQNRSRHC